MIPYGRQDISQADIDAVVAVLLSEYLTQGPAVPSFEKNIADYCGVNHAVAVNSATSALHIACLALGLGPGDWLWTTPNTFVASANCGLYCGANIDFVDIDPESLNMSVDRLTEKLIDASRSGKLPKIVIPVHFSGQPCDMARIRKLSIKYGFKIIEDASHAIGAKYKNKPVGACEYSDITVFSFHPVKIITTGEGGMAVTNNDQIASQLKLLRSHGITRNSVEMNKAPEGDWYYQQIALGYNYRMTDIQAALGLSQMRRLDEYVCKRHLIANRYDNLLSETYLTLPRKSEEGYSAFHLYVIQLKSVELSPFRREFFGKLRESGIGVNVHYIPVHLHPYYLSMGFKDGDFPAAENYYKNALTIPMYPNLTESQQEYVVEMLKKCMATFGVNK